MGINRFPAKTVQYTQYYPSGLPLASNPGDNPYYKYNDKEFIEMNGYDTYDYVARGYYPAIGRFITVDPLCEKYYSISPYAYCAGNPVKFIDPDGRGLFDNIIKLGSDLLKSFTVNTSVGFQVGVKATVAGKGVEVKANVASANFGGVSNGKSTFNLANPSVTKEATVKYAGVGVSTKTEVKDTGNGTVQKTETLSASAVIVTVENTKTTNYVESNNGNYTELSKKEDNIVKATDSNVVRVGVTAIVGVEVSFDWNKAAKGLKTFIDSVQ